MAASVSQNGRFRAVFLSVIMVLMTQVGYTDNMDFSIGLNQDTESKDTGGSTPALTPSVEGADLMVGDLMDEITFQYDASAASGSGSNSNSGTYNGNGTAWMVKDINTGTSNNGGSMSAMYLEQDAVMGNEMYFFATDSTNGYELWKSDGTESGTVMVKDINNGSGSSMPSSSSITGVNSNLHLKAMNNTNTLFFVANDGIHGEELWKTDGTASGTVMVKDINSANGNSGHSDIGEFTQMGSTLYFRADDGTNGQELWKTDGTSSGTVMVKDINPGNAGVVDCNCLRAITVVGNTLYFTADDGTHGEELWKSDGTTSGTVMVKNINTDALGAEDSSIQRISVAGNYIYFQATCGSNDCPGSSGSALFRSDGTAAGTVVIKANDFIWTRPTITIGNTLFFVGGSNWNATIWKSNGTSSGTTMAVDVLPQTNTLYTLGDGNGVRRCDRNVGNSFYFMARDHGAGGGLDTRYLWKTDGTASGTVQVKDVNNANVTGGWSTCGIIGDTLFFVKQETRQLWKTNGTSSGTKMIIDMDSLSPSGYGSLSWNFASINNKLYFGAGDGTNGIELWALDPANITGIGSGSGSGSSSSSAFAYANDKVSGGTHQTCAILDNGDLKCWGRDNNGQLGDGGSNTDLNAPSSTAIDLGTGRTAVAVSSGDDFTCAILDNGDLKCWGRDQYGQLGDGGGNTNTNAPSSTAIDLGTGRTAISIAAGYDHACAILDNGDLKCWGRNNYGQLGDGTGGDFTEDNNRLTPTPTASLGTGRTAVAVSAGFGHTCAILDNGEAKCWGRDQYGQLGDGGSAWTSSNPTDTNAPSSTAIDLGTGRTAITVSAGHGHTCAILDNGDLKCWGNDGDGQLGDGGPAWTSSNPTSTNTPSSTAIDLGTGRTAVAVSAGRTYHSCAILDNGEAKCWGRDQYGQLGEDPNQNEGNLDPDTMPIDLGTGRTAVAMSAGGPHTCAILDNGDMKCWGNDLFGQLGDGGTNTNQGEPVLVSGSNTWDSSTTASSGSSGGMTNVTGANCTVSPALPTDLSIDSSTCTISGTPSVATSNTTYTVTANISGTTYQGTVWLATMTFGTIISPVMGAELDLGEAMTPITLNYTSQALNTPPPVSWETHPELPEGMSISNGVISGTPTVYAVNQTYTIYANQSGETTTFDMYFSVDTNNPHTVVENQPIDAIGFHGPFQNGTTNWTVSPALPADLVMDANTGEITGSVNGVLANTTYTVNATHSDGATETFTFSLQSLADFDGDGLPNELPSDYDAAERPTPGLVADTDDDADGLEDAVETGTSIYVDSNNTGSNPLDPDTDDDGICDGPNAVPPICIAGPDSTPNGDSGPPIWIGLFNKEGTVLGPYKSLLGGTYEIMPDLPQSLTMDPNTGVISGTPTQTLENTTFTVWVNRSDGASLSWNFSIEILADSDGDGFPDQLPDDYNSSNPTAPGLVEDLDDDNDGVSDSEEETDGIDPTNPDTDGDGVCDGSIAVDPVCVAGPDAFPLDPSADTDTDGDGKPDSITGNSTSVPPLEEDMDDDGDGFSDELEIISGSDPLDANDVPADLDGDGDGLNNTVETDTGIYNSTIDTGTDPLNPDTDGDGICDGPLSVAGICGAGPDAFPLDPSADTDTDGDGMPDTLTGASTSNPPLVEDDDDDNDGFSDELENNCGSDPLDANDSPADLDGDNICDLMDSDIDGDGLNNTVETNTGIYNSTTDTGTDPLNPDTDGDGICDGPSAPANGGCEAGPDAFPFDPSASKDTDGDGMPDTLTGASTSNPQLVEDEDDDNDGVNDVKEIDCGTDPLDNQSIPALNSEGNCMDATSSGEVDDGGFSYMWCVPCLLILLLLLLIPMLSGRDRVLGMLLVGPEPENTTSEPEFIGGAGTRDDPFILAPAEGVKPGESVSSTEVITIDKMSRINVDMMDFNQEINGDRFSMYETDFDEIGTRIIEVGDDGEITINMLFDDGVGEPTYEGGEFTGLLKLGRASVYLSWTVTIDPDKKKLKEIEKQLKADEKAAKKAEEAEAKKMAKKEAEAKKKAEEEAAALLAEEEEEEAAAAEAKAAAAEKKAKEEADAEAKKVKVAEEKAAKKKAEEEAKAAAAAKPASKEEKKKAELERVKERSKSIDFKVLGTAKASDKDDLQVIKGIGPFIEEKLNALGIYTYLQISKMTSKLEDNVNEAIEFFPGRVKRDQWVAQAKSLLGEDVKIDEKALKKAEELARVAAKAEKIDFGTIGVASATDKDNLQELKGIGPFIEEKLNALGIFKFEQIAKMTSKIEDEVNIAIEFFPGRVKRDEWVKQAKERTK